MREAQPQRIFAHECAAPKGAVTQCFLINSSIYSLALILVIAVSSNTEYRMPFILKLADLLRVAITTCMTAALAIGMTICTRFSTVSFTVFH